jgi:hypothetical protein
LGHAPSSGQKGSVTPEGPLDKKASMAFELGRAQTPSNFRFEFDAANRILLARFHGRLTDELLEEFYREAGRHWTATDPRAGIADYSLVTEVAVSVDFVRYLAKQEPTADVSGRPRYIVASRTHTFGLARMFQIVGESKRPLLQVVHTLEEALAALGVQSAHFEPLDSPQDRS